MHSIIKFLSLADIPRMVLETAHWSGMIKRVYTRNAAVKEVTDDGKKYKQFRVRSTPGYRIINEEWRSEEELLNQSINAVLLALAPKDVAYLAAGLFPQATPTARAHLCQIGWRTSTNANAWDLTKSVVGAPDICISSKNKQLVFLLELKVSAKRNNAKYSLQQHVKYAAFKLLLEAEGKEVHVGLLVPSTDGNLEFLHGREKGWFTQNSGGLALNIKAINARPMGIHKNVKTFEEYREHVAKQVNTHSLPKNPLHEEPISLLSFDDLESMIPEARAGHLRDAFRRIREYATGEV